MNKKLFILLLLFAVLLIGCGTNQSRAESDSPQGNMILVDRCYIYEGRNTEIGFNFYREIYTDVMFVEAEGENYSYAGRALTVMPDPVTGLPLTYQKWLLYKRAKQNESK